MKINEIINIFSEIAVHTCEYVPTFTIACLLEVEVIMKNGVKITVLCGEEEFIDCSSESASGHLGIGDTLIEPICDIEEIYLKIR